MFNVSDIVYHNEYKVGIVEFIFDNKIEVKFVNSKELVDYDSLQLISKPLIDKIIYHQFTTTMSALYEVLYLSFFNHFIEAKVKTKFDTSEIVININDINYYQARKKILLDIIFNYIKEQLIKLEYKFENKLTEILEFINSNIEGKVEEIKIFRDYLDFIKNNIDDETFKIIFNAAKNTKNHFLLYYLAFNNKYCKQIIDYFDTFKPRFKTDIGFLNTYRINKIEVNTRCRYYLYNGMYVEFCHLLDKEDNLSEIEKLFVGDEIKHSDDYTHFSTYHGSYNLILRYIIKCLSKEDFIKAVNDNKIEKLSYSDFTNKELTFEAKHLKYLPSSELFDAIKELIKLDYKGHVIDLINLYKNLFCLDFKDIENTIITNFFRTRFIDEPYLYPILYNYLCYHSSLNHQFKALSFHENTNISFLKYFDIKYLIHAFEQRFYIDIYVYGCDKQIISFCVDQDEDCYNMHDYLRLLSNEVFCKLIYKYQKKTI